MKRTLTLMLLLSGCIIQAPAKTPEPQTILISHPMPAPVWPDECVANWYAQTKLPPCVESWITDITKQQKTIEKKRKKRTHSAPHATESHLEIQTVK